MKIIWWILITLAVGIFLGAITKTPYYLDHYVNSDKFVNDCVGSGDYYFINGYHQECEKLICPN